MVAHIQYKTEKVKNSTKTISDSNQLALLLGNNHYHQFILYPSRKT